MIKINDNNIFVGYIKELLGSYNLPNARIHKKDTPYLDGQIYLESKNFYRYSDNKLNYIKSYVEGKNNLNYTRKLKYSGITYDYHTHEYLGDYLRFLRDYKKINLMSMYNCYSNRYAEYMNTYVNITSNSGDSTSTKTYNFNTENPNYKIIMLPVKFFEKYTIAIDSPFEYEMFCGFYGKYYYEESDIDTIAQSSTTELSSSEKQTEKYTLINELKNRTFVKVSSSKFSEPYLYDKLTMNNEELTESVLTVLADYEKDLKLFIKLPLNNTSSITILEGDYRNVNDFTYCNNLIIKQSDAKEANPFNQVYNSFDFNFKKADPNDPTKDVDYTFDLCDFPIRTRMQLLYINSNESYAFADRLIEYLVGNVVSKMDDIHDNIKRVQKYLYNLYLGEYDAKTGKTTYKYNVDHKGTDGEIAYSEVFGIEKIGKYYGIWDEKYALLLYNLAKRTNVLNENFDILGYLDKDLEKKLALKTDIYKEE